MLLKNPATTASPLPVTVSSPTVFPVSDNGGSLTVDGAVSVTGTVAVSGSVEVANDSGNPLPVSGTVEITNDVGNAIPVSGSVSATVSGTVNVDYAAGNPTRNLAGAVRSASQTTLLDGKILGADDATIFDNKGTGTGTYTANKFNMSVTSGQYYIRQSRRFFPYFSGKVQVVEQTFDGMQTEANTIKRVGYFSSTAVAPYDSAYDGFWLEDDGTTKRVVAYRNGTKTVDSPFSSWVGYSTLQAKDWSKFTVIMWEFLWLGGAGLKLWVATASGWVLAFSMSWVELNADTFIASPNQPLRYSIRSTTGSGSFRYICSQIATEGSSDEAGKSLSLYNSTLLTVNTVGTLYFMMAIRKLAAFITTPIEMRSIGSINGQTTDAGVLMLVANPTLTGAALTWATSGTGRFEVAYNTNVNQVMTAGTGRVIAAIPISSQGMSFELERNYLAWLSQQIDNTMDVYALIYMPVTANQSALGIVTLKEY